MVLIALAVEIGKTGSGLLPGRAAFSIPENTVGLMAGSVFYIQGMYCHGGGVFRFVIFLNFK